MSTWNSQQVALGGGQLLFTVKSLCDTISYVTIEQIYEYSIRDKQPAWCTVLFYVFISILYMFRATSCSSSGESIVSIKHLVYVTLCRWPFRVQVTLCRSKTKRSPTQSDIYQMFYWYNWFSWWWARGCSKHAENWNKYVDKNCVSSWPFVMNHNEMHSQHNIKRIFSR